MADPNPQITVAIVDGDTTFSAMLAAVLRGNDLVASVLTFHDPARARIAFDADDANALIIDLFTVGPNAGIDLIEYLRKSHRAVPICLIGERNRLLTMPNVPDSWRTRFGHYYQMQKDQLPDDLRATTEIMVRMLGSYWLAGRARVRLKDLPRLVLAGRRYTHEEKEDQRQIQEIVDLAESALDAKTEVADLPIVIPGIHSSEVGAVIMKTIQDASSALERSALVNKAILLVGAFLVLASFVVASTTHAWEAVAFGGFGLAGVIGSLITNPLKSIGIGARRIVQLQVAYVSFLNQVAMLNGLHAPDVVLERSKQLDVITRSLQETLEKHFGE